jgi:hypothetical protein
MKPYNTVIGENSTLRKEKKNREVKVDKVVGEEINIPQALECVWWNPSLGHKTYFFLFFSFLFFLMEIENCNDVQLARTRFHFLRS